MIKKISQAIDMGKNICIIVPDQYSFEFDKKLYRSIGAKRYNEVTVLSFSRLSQDIFIKYGGKTGEYANDLTKVSLMYIAIKYIQDNEKFNFYQKQAGSAHFINSALQIVKELKWSNITPEDLMLKTSFLKDNIYDKVNDISILYSTYYKVLEQNGYKDSLNDITEAAKLASLNGYFKNTTVFVDEFQSFSGDEIEMIETIISTADELNVSLTMDEIPKLKSSLFAISNDTYFDLVQISNKYNFKVQNEIQEKAYRFSSSDIEFLSKNIFRPIRGTSDYYENIKICEASDMYLEIDFVCTEIRRLIKDNNYKFNEIAIISRQLSDYSNILESAFVRYEIPYFLDANKPVMHKSITLLVMSIFEITTQEFPSTESVLKYAKTGLVGISFSKLLALENYCYKWNIDAELWTEDFIKIDKNTDDYINDIRKKIINPLSRFKDATKNATGKVICKELYKLFEAINLDKNISGIAASVNDDEVEALEVARELKQLWNVLIQILEAMYNSLGDTIIPLKDFGQLLRIMLSESTFANPPQTLDCITVSSAERARLASPKVVFVIGVNEGFYPFAVKSQGLFTDKDKTILEEVGLKLSINTKHKLNEERFITYSTLSSPSEKLFITYPLSDSTGKSRFPSFIIEQITKMFKGPKIIRISDLPTTYFCTTEKAAYYNYVQSYNRNNEYSASLRSYLQNNEHYAGKIAYLDKINENSTYEIKDKKITKQLFGEKLVVSASRFEEFNKCHFLYFCKKGLNLYPPQKIEFNAMEQGDVIHKCMYYILSAYDKDEFVTQTESDLRLKIKKIIDEYYESKLGGDFGKTSRFKALYNKLVDIIIEVLVHLQNEFSQSDFIPTDFELEISDNDDVKPMKLVSKTGMEISFIGTIDRVDTYNKDNKLYVRVVDYKSGDKTFKLEDVYYGINMQMLLYLFTLTQGESKYTNYVPAGVLYMPSKELEPELDRQSSEEDLKIIKDKNFKMNGILLDDESVIKAMEKEVNGIYVPVKKSKDGFTKTSSLITSKQIDNLRKYANDLLIEMGDKLNNGDIDAFPLSNGKTSPCDYCDYWSICGNESKKIRIYDIDVKDKIQSVLNGGEGNGKQMDTTTASSD